jgi:hypothetical protein
MDPVLQRQVIGWLGVVLTGAAGAYIKDESLRQAAVGIVLAAGAWLFGLITKGPGHVDVRDVEAAVKAAATWPPKGAPPSGSPDLGDE